MEVPGPSGSASEEGPGPVDPDDYYDGEIEEPPGDNLPIYWSKQILGFGSPTQFLDKPKEERIQMSKVSETGDRYADLGLEFSNEAEVLAHMRAIRKGQEAAEASRAREAAEKSRGMKAKGKGKGKGK